MMPRRMVMEDRDDLPTEVTSSLSAGQPRDLRRLEPLIHHHPRRGKNRSPRDGSQVHHQVAVVTVHHQGGAGGEDPPTDYQDVFPDYKEVPEDCKEVPIDYEEMPADYQEVPADYQEVSADYQEVPEDYEEMPADYDDDDDADDDYADNNATTSNTAIKGVHNLGFVSDTDVVLHMMAPPTETEPEAEIATTTGNAPAGRPRRDAGSARWDQPAAGTTSTLQESAVVQMAEEAGPRRRSGGEPEVVSAAVALMAPEILAAADVEELLGRLTEDGRLLANRPHRRQVFQRHVSMATADVGTQLDKIYRQLKRDDGAQLLDKSTVKLTGYQGWKFERVKAWNQSKAAAREALADFTIWDSAFKDIEGHFGSPVLAYFGFLKWLFLLDLLLAMLFLGVVIFPQVFMKPTTFDDYLQNMGTNDSRFTGVYANQARRCSEKYATHVKNVISNSSAITSILDFVQGTGWMELTPVFIGYYFNRTYTNIITSKTVQYNMSVGYLLAVLSYFLISLLLMVRFTAMGMKQRMTATDHFYQSCNKVFCGWDFSLAERKAVTFKQNQLYQEYIRDIAVRRRKERQQNQTPAKKCQLISIRLFVNILVICILGASGYLIYYVSDESTKWLGWKGISGNAFLKLLVEFLPSLTMTILNFIVPLVFHKLVLLEDYSPTLEIKFTITRSVILRLASVAVLVLGIGSRLLTCEQDIECNSCTDVTLCWETYFGQQFYKLVLLDFVTVVMMTFFVQFPRKFIVDRFKDVKFFQIVGYQEFEIPKEVLDIVYSQTLCWIGGFVSPIIFCMTVMKMFLFFYIKKTALMNTCDPSPRVFRASNSQAFFMAMLILSFVLCALPVAFAIGKISPSKSCSPFRLYSNEEYFMFSSVVDLVADWSKWLQNIILFLTSWTFYLPFIVIICLVIYVYISLAAGKRQMIKILLQQLVLEGKDKQYLLAQVRKAIAHGDFKKTV